MKNVLNLLWWPSLDCRRLLGHHSSSFLLFPPFPSPSEALGAGVCFSRPVQVLVWRGSAESLWQSVFWGWSAKPPPATVIAPRWYPHDQSTRGSPQMWGCRSSLMCTVLSAYPSLIWASGKDYWAHLHHLLPLHRRLKHDIILSKPLHEMLLLTFSGVLWLWSLNTNRLRTFFSLWLNMCLFLCIFLVSKLAARCCRF